MVFEIELSDEAKLDLFEARDHYSRISEKILSRFDDAIISEIERLESHPENFQKRYRDIKIVFTKIFPYGIHYFVDNHTVYIQRVLHQKQFYK